MAMTNHECAMGIYPLNGNASEDHEVMREQFAPRGLIDKSDPKFHKAVCHGCDQVTLIKMVMPRKGYFTYHKASVQREAPGFSMGSTGNNKSGKPARVRGREVYVRKKD